MVSNAVHRALQTELAVERAKREVQARHIASTDVLMRFLCARINQIEAERAALLKKIGVDVPVAEMVAPRTAPNVDGEPPAATDARQRMLDSLAGAAMFEDVGDDAAKTLGLAWNPDGSVKYPEQEVTR